MERSFELNNELYRQIRVLNDNFLEIADKLLNDFEFRKNFLQSLEKHFGTITPYGKYKNKSYFIDRSVRVLAVIRGLCYNCKYGIFVLIKGYNWEKGDVNE